MVSDLLDLGGLGPFSPLKVVLGEGTKLALFQEGGVDDGGSDNVGVHVRGRASILNVALLLGGGRGGDAD